LKLVLNDNLPHIVPLIGILAFVDTVESQSAQLSAFNREILVKSRGSVELGRRNIPIYPHDARCLLHDDFHAVLHDVFDIGDDKFMFSKKPVLIGNFRHLHDETRMVADVTVLGFSIDMKLFEKRTGEIHKMRFKALNPAAELTPFYSISRAVGKLFRRTYIVKKDKNPSDGQTYFVNHASHQNKEIDKVSYAI